MKELRDKIDKIDREITSLFEQRMDVVKEVIDYKIKHKLPILNSSREEQVIEKNTAYLKNAEYAPYLREFYTDLMTVSRKMQADIAGQTSGIAYQGVPGSFSHEATEKYLAMCHESMTVKNYATFESLMNALLNDDVKYIVIPLENTSTGAVTDVYDLLTQYDFYINGEISVKVHHNLLVNEGTKIGDIKEIYSHPQAFMQCRDYLHNLSARQIPHYNTATSAKFVSESGRHDIAAIASERAAQIYGLKVLEHNINYNSNNITKFIILSKQQCQNPKADKISVVVSIEHKAGSLASILDLFAKSKLNLTNIQSRPDTANPFEYIFFLDFEGSMADENTRQTVNVLKSKCTKFKYLGNYV